MLYNLQFDNQLELSTTLVPFLRSKTFFSLTFSNYDYVMNKLDAIYKLKLRLSSMLHPYLGSLSPLLDKCPIHSLSSMCYNLGFCVK